MKPDCPSTAADTAEIVSEAMLYPSRSGLKIAAFWDHRREDFEGCPFVVMAPKYGETKKNNLQLAYMLAANGMNVVRFDHTCHMGESHGDPLQFTLPGAVDDIHAAIDHVAARFGIDSMGLIGNSLSSRPALRAAAENPRVAFLISVVGVVNFRYSLQAVYREDVVGQYLAGRRWGVNDVLGYMVDFDHFLEAVLKADMHDLTGTIEDARRLKIPLDLYQAENDAWVDAAEVQKVAAAAAARLHAMQGVMHEVRENASAAEQLFREIASTCLERSYSMSAAPKTLLAPSRTCLLRQNRLERERLRRAANLERDEKTFWSDYLNKFDYIKEGRAYRGYLDLLLDLISPIRPGEVLLDAGCGNGVLGIWAQRYLSHEVADPEQEPAVWLSADLTDSGLREAMSKHLSAARLASDRRGEGERLGLAYMRTDLDTKKAGPRAGTAWLAAESVDCIVASLLVSYLSDPPAVMAEFFRILRPGGRIIVSSMKPHCDMSGIYRDFIDEGVSRDRLEPARDLLRAAGAIRMKEECGFYEFFGVEELTKMLTQAGFVRGTSFIAFGDQAVVVRAEK